jgi:hypothetical protein
MGSLTDPSVICNEILVYFKSLIPNLSKTDFGIRLTLAPRSHNAFLNLIFPKEQSIVKLPLFKVLEATCLSHLSLDIISFKHLA